MAATENRDELLATVASLYYKLNQSQGEIATRLELSTSTVSRLLREAHDKGIVQIHIQMPIPRDLELEQLFIKRFGLKDIYILQSPVESTADTLLRAIGQLAAAYVKRIIDSFPAGSSIGVAWGTGVHATVSALPDHFTQNVDVVQLMGGVGELVIDGPDLGRVVAQKLGGRHYDLHAPVLVERAITREMFLQEPMVRDSIERARAVKLAIVGIGSIQDEASSFLRAGLLSRMDLLNLRQQGVVGEICGHFFDRSGRCEPFEINQRIMGLELDDLRQIPHSIAIARGLAKAQAIYGVLKAGFIRVLATDDITARAVFDLANADLSKKS